MTELATLILERLVERRDVYAVQRANGSYNPVEGELSADLVDRHLLGELTIGHYLVCPPDRCRVLAFDIDLTTSGHWTSYDEEDGASYECNPREVFRDEAHRGRDSLVVNLRSAASAIAGHTKRLLRAPVVVTASGSKGLHVYAMTGTQRAADLRQAGITILRSFRQPDGSAVFEPDRGASVFRSVRNPNYVVELFPKQSSLKDDAFGNLMRLPLGVNRRSNQNGFVVDQRAGLDVLHPSDPIRAFAEGDVW